MNSFAEATHAAYLEMGYEDSFGYVANSDGEFDPCPGCGGDCGIDCDENADALAEGQELDSGEYRGPGCGPGCGC